MTRKKGKHESPAEVQAVTARHSKKWIIKTLAIALGAVIVIGVTGILYASSKLDRISYAFSETPTAGAEQDDSKNETPEASPEITAAPETPAASEDEFDIIGSSDPPEGNIFKDKNIVNILLIGTDAADGGPKDPGRADCVMLCSLNEKTGDVKLISFERGISVQFDIPPYSSILTHTYSHGGSELVLKTIEKYFLLDIAGYVHVSYDAFIAGIDAIGGVDIELTKKEAAALNEECYTNAATKARVYEGTNHLDGYDALQYCRLRFVDSDWHRIERQRNAVQAALTQAKSLSLKQLNSVADQMLPLIETNLPKSDIVSLLFHAPKFIGAQTEQMTVPEHIPGDSVVRCHFDKETEKIMTFIYGDKADKHYDVNDVPATIVY